MEQMKILRYKFKKDSDPKALAKNLVDNYRNALKDGIEFESIELKIEDTDRDYQILGEIYKLDPVAYHLLDVQH